jgi:hypothetical protein
MQVRATATRGVTAKLGVVPAAHAAALTRDASPRFKFKVPAGWWPGESSNPYAAAAEPQILEWFRALGCSEAEVQRAARFDAAGYVGIPFPRLSLEKTLMVGKYLSLWLLWDDVQVECMADRWRIDAEHVLAGRPPPDMTRFDEGWWQLFSGFARTHSPRWIEDLCQAMHSWNEAALQEAVAVRRFRERGIYPRFARQMNTRIATIGMYATIYLLEDAYGSELPTSFHDHPSVLRMKVLAGAVVGLGNDILSLGKDLVEGQPNLVSTLMHEEGLAGPEAIERLIRMHDRALLEFDVLAAGLAGWGADVDPLVARWVQDVRCASLGFSLWEAQAPRYTAHKIVCDGVVIELGFMRV